MFRVFNMGTGFCVVVAAEDAPRAREFLARSDRRVLELGRADARAGAGSVIIEPFKLAWSKAEKRFEPL